MTQPTESSDVRTLVAAYLTDGKLMQFATAVDNQPWVAHLWYAMDEGLRLYFISRNDRRHCRELRAQNRVAGAIVAIELAGLGQKVRGLAFQGTADELSDGALEEGYSHYARRWPLVTQQVSLDDMQRGVSPVRVYRFDPTLYVLFDELNFPTQPRQELPIQSR